MTGFDETVPPDDDPAADATSAQDAGDNVVPPEDGPEGAAARERAPEGGPEFVDADDERPPSPS